MKQIKKKTYTVTTEFNNTHISDFTVEDCKCKNGKINLSGTMSCFVDTMLMSDNDVAEAAISREEFNEIKEYIRQNYPDKWNKTEERSWDNYPILLAVVNGEFEITLEEDKFVDLGNGYYQVNVNDEMYSTCCYDVDVYAFFSDFPKASIEEIRKGLKIDITQFELSHFDEFANNLLIYSAKDFSYVEVED